MNKYWAIEYKAKNGRWVFLMDNYIIPQIPKPMTYKEAKHTIERTGWLKLLALDGNARPREVQITRVEEK